MKLKTVSVLTVLCICISSSLVKAQFRLGFQASSLKLPSSAGNYGRSFGPGVDFAYNPEESRFEYFFNGAYFLPASSSMPYTVYSNVGATANATLTSKTSLIGLVLGARYFFMDRTENDFSLYATANLNLVLGHTSATLSNLPAGFDASYNALDGAGGNTKQAMIGLGIGGEYNVGSGSIFAEANYRFPTGEYNSRTGYSGDVQIPGHPWFSVGYRFSLGGDN
jgi:hypothetical protein